MARLVVKAKGSPKWQRWHSRDLGKRLRLVNIRSRIHFVQRNLIERSQAKHSGRLRLYVDRLLVIDCNLKLYRLISSPADQQLRQHLGVFILFVSERVEDSDVVRQLAVASLRTVDEQ
jgi:hypothetical protein